MIKHTTPIHVLLTLVLLTGLLGCAATATPTPTAPPITTSTSPPTHTYTPPPTATDTPAPTDTPPPTATPTATSEPTPTSGLNQPGKYLDVIISQGRIRWYLLYVPSSYQPGTPMPLVLSFHGAGSNHYEQELVSAMTIKAEEEGFMVVYPKAQGIESFWYLPSGVGGDVDLNFVTDLIEYLESKLAIDPQRIYATGFSNGAGLVDSLGCRLADKIAAIAPVAGVYTYWEDCTPSRPLPVVSFHGTADTAAPFQGMGSSIPNWAANWAERNGCDPTPVITYQKGEVTGETWSNCDQEATVTL
jgi:polyhydroxybutyrate depolymerase